MIRQNDTFEIYNMFESNNIIIIRERTLSLNKFERTYYLLSNTNFNYYRRLEQEISTWNFIIQWSIQSFYLYISRKIIQAFKSKSIIIIRERTLSLNKFERTYYLLPNTNFNYYRRLEQKIFT